MTLVRDPGFDIPALYAALDTQRQARGLSWRETTGEINALFGSTPARPISQSTITGLREVRVAEADGVLQMLRWLDRSPESFINGHADNGQPTTRLPDVPPDKILRFDTRNLYEALNAQRTEKQMSWPQVAAEVGGLSAASLTGLSKGGRTGFPQVMRITRWLNRPAASFVRISAR